MKIGEAIAALKKGAKVSRKLWEGDCLNKKYIKYIILANKGKSIWVHLGKKCPGFHWHHDHHDLLADDYYIYEEAA